MMKIIAAFQWDSSNKKISYMIIDKDYSILCGPSENCFPQDYRQFKLEASKVVKNFFNEIEKINKLYSGQ